MVWVDREGRNETWISCVKCVLLSLSGVLGVAVRADGVLGEGESPGRADREGLVAEINHAGPRANATLSTTVLLAST